MLDETTEKENITIVYKDEKSQIEVSPWFRGAQSRMEGLLSVQGR